MIITLLPTDKIHVEYSKDRWPYATALMQGVRLNKDKLLITEQTQTCIHTQQHMQTPPHANTYVYI